MNIEGFNEQQRQALLDLAILAMYADGHLAAVEDARVQRLLTAMGYESDHDRGRHYDASVSRVSRHSQTADAARAYATTMAQNFGTRELQRQALDVLNDLLRSDGQIVPRESDYLEAVKEAFQR